MENAVIAAIVAIVFGAAVVQTTIGFGYSLLFAPLAALVISPREAIAASLITSTLLAVGLFWEHRPRASTRGIAPLVLAGILGTPLGLLLLVRLDETALHVLVGAGVIVSAIVGMLRAGHAPVERRGRTGAMLISGVLSGIMRGSVSFPGPPIVLYLHWAGGSPHTIRGRLFAYFLLTAIPGVLMAWWAGVITSSVWTITLAAVPAIGAGILVGRWLRDYVSPLWFRQLSMLLLVLSAAAAIGGAVLEWRG